MPERKEHDMTIHHATIKKAAKLNFALTEADHGNGLLVTARDTGGSKLNISAPRPAGEVLAAAILARTFHYEYPAMTVGFDLESGFWVTTHHDDIDVEIVTRSPDVPDLADVLELCEDKGLDPEIGVDDVEAPTGSVVKEEYKVRYRPHGGTSGDWLAKQLDTFKNKSGQLDIESFLDMCAANGVDISGAWAVEGNRGWQGRARMTGRIKLAVQVALNNELVIGKTKITPPKSWVKAHLPKPKKAKKTTKKG